MGPRRGDRRFSESERSCRASVDGEADPGRLLDRLGPGDSFGAAYTSGGSATPPNIRRTIAPPFTVRIRSGSLGSWKNATYQDFRICRQCLSAVRKHSGCGPFMITSRSNGWSCSAAKHQATIATQSRPISTTLLAPAALINAVTSSTRCGIVCDLRGPGGAPVSALIDRPDAIAHSCQHRYLVPPGDGVLRKAVQAERQPVSGDPPPAPRSATRWPQRTWSAYRAFSNVRANPIVAGSTGVSLRAAA